MKMPTQDDDISDVKLMTKAPFVTCYSNNSVFQVMLSSFWTSIMSFIEQNPEHEHAKQWKLWMEQGFTRESNLTFVKNILQTETLDQLYIHQLCKHRSTRTRFPTSSQTSV